MDCHLQESAHISLIPFSAFHPSSLSALESEEQPAFSMYSSMMHVFDAENAKAVSAARCRSLAASTLLTPLLPAESVGFTNDGIRKRRQLFMTDEMLLKA